MVKMYSMYIGTTFKGIANMTIEQLMIQLVEVHINQTICPFNYLFFLLKIDT